MTGEVIQMIRAGLKMDRKDLAELSGYSPTYIKDMERGARRVSEKAAARILEAIQARGVTPGDVQAVADMVGRWKQ